MHAPQTPCSQPTCVPVSPRRVPQEVATAGAAARPPRGRTRPLTRDARSRSRRPLPGQRALDERAGQRAQVRGGRVDGCRAGRPARGQRPASARGLGSRTLPTRLDLEQRSGGRRPRRRRRDASTTSRRRRAEHDRDHREREVAARGARAPRTRRLARRRGGQIGLDDELARLERGREVRDEELVGRRSRAAARAVDDDRAAERDEAERQLGGARPRARSSRRPCRGSASRSGRRRAAPRATSGCARSSRRERGLARRRADASGRRSLLTPSRPARLRSTSSVGRTSRMLSAGTRLWPPASGFASSPSLRERASASSSDSRPLVAERRGLHPVSIASSSQTRGGVSGSSRSSHAERVGDRVRDRDRRRSSSSPRRAPSRRAA